MNSILDAVAAEEIVGSISGITRKIISYVSGSGQERDEYWDKHLAKTWEYASLLAFSYEKKRKQPNREALFIAVQLHDIAKILDLNGGPHYEVGANLADALLKGAEYKHRKLVVNAIRSHSGAKGSPKPGSLEGKILASADAMSNFDEELFPYVAKRHARQYKTFEEFAFGINQKYREYWGKMNRKAKKLIGRRYTEMMENELTEKNLKEIYNSVWKL